VNAILPIRISIGQECTTIACVKALTDRIDRTGHGMWMAEPEASFVRAAIYNAAGINDWSLANDREACKRLPIWARLFWIAMRELEVM
jgi:hypothetical protein